ncbi:hypothetical protein POM88_002514 [Heracleum sosnowskyi]|uniref:Uncharacterized protein n=1 Tax=Heracleum sosnowskyi TaxID=360622 RepID=A0AAD8JEV1_9APIA|nr:hypothetical protein POM88_002514 [Heracleum sosnowskyi]
MLRDHFISCPQLVNLNISTTFCETHGFVVLAPKLSNFSSSGIFPIRFGVCELQKVDIKLQDWAGVGGEQYYPPFISMLLGLGNYANNLTFDSKSIEVNNISFDDINNGFVCFWSAQRLLIVNRILVAMALSKISYLLVGLPSPFYKLTNVKLPRGYKESSIPEALRNYLLGGSPKASIVT